MSYIIFLKYIHIKLIQSAEVTYHGTDAISYPEQLPARGLRNRHIIAQRRVYSRRDRTVGINAQNVVPQLEYN